MELNQDQIIKALECCTRGRKSEEDRLCLDCPYNECNLVGGTSERQTKGTCQGWLMKDTLALIKELTEENEGLIVDNSALLESKYTPHKYPEGTLRVKLNVPKGSGITYRLRSVRQIKIDTVGEMAYRIKKYFPHDADSGLYAALDQIIKEMIGESNE